MKALQDRFREFRRRKPAIQPEGVKVEFKFKGRPKSSGGPHLKRPKLDVPPGEDSTSFLRHNKFLLGEFTKAHPNRASVAEAMKLSYSMRRKDITSSERPVLQLLNLYPFLGDKDEVKYTDDS